ncbi:hypothetical protein TSAR_004419 [Trichomalopsis sarcophagae]|uniref:Uncharacterized protein n=1 Tax=Trichomalopsis sarcophagae TaxID=543379 RepID=A0A232EV77_9HYME|nr:hypothetical protein TSAR_004419 [Trichomalopsis sarcophagae]
MPLITIKHGTRHERKREVTSLSERGNDMNEQQGNVELSPRESLTMHQNYWRKSGPTKTSVQREALLNERDLRRHTALQEPGVGPSYNKSGSPNSLTPARAATNGQRHTRIKAKTGRPKQALPRRSGRQSTTAMSILDSPDYHPRSSAKYHLGSTTVGHPQQ